MQTIRLPRLGGTREAADALLDASIGSEESLRNETIILLGRDLLSSSESFADQIVKRLLEQEHVSDLVLIAPPKRFEHNVRDSANRRGFANKVRKESAATLGV